MARVRMKFSKTGAVRFLSHLDLLKCLERSLRRIQAPVSYTEGFHPRMRIGFGPALALGATSTSEWMDLELGAELAPDALAEQLNPALPQGLHVLEARRIPAATPSLQATLRRAVYRVRLECRGAAPGVLEVGVRRVLAEQEILLVKKNKTVNLRSFVEELRVLDASDETDILELALRLGPEGAIRPEDLLKVVTEGFPARVLSIERTHLLEPRGGQWVEPWPPEPEVSPPPDPV